MAWELLLGFCLAGLVVVLAVRANRRRYVCHHCCSVLVLKGTDPRESFRPCCPECGREMEEVSGA